MTGIPGQYSRGAPTVPSMVMVQDTYKDATSGTDGLPQTPLTVLPDIQIHGRGNRSRLEYTARTGPALPRYPQLDALRRFRMAVFLLTSAHLSLCHFFSYLLSHLPRFPSFLPPYYTHRSSPTNFHPLPHEPTFLVLLAPIITKVSLQHSAIPSINRLYVLLLHRPCSPHHNPYRIFS